MVDVVLDDAGTSADDRGTPPSRRRPADDLRSAAGSLRRHGRAVLALGAGLVLVAGSAGAAQVAEYVTRAHDLTARMEAIDRALLTTPAMLSARWTSPSDLFSRLVTATDGLLVLYSADRTSVSALDADSRVQVWEQSLPEGEAFVTCAAPQPTVDSFACVIGRGTSTVALAEMAVADGAELARFDLPDRASLYLFATDDADVLLISTGPDGAGTVTRRSPLDGALRWTAAVPAPESPAESTGLGSSVLGGVIQLNGLLDATLDLATGAPVTALPAGTSADWSFVTTQALPDGGVALWRTSSNSGDQRGVVRAPTGSIRFELTVPPFGPTPDDGSVPGVLLLSTGLSIDAVDAMTGELRWHAEVIGSGIDGAVRYDGALDLASSSTETSSIAQYDLQTGDLTWSTVWDGVQHLQLFLAGDSLLVAGASAEKANSDSYQGGLDRLAVVDLHDGSVRELAWPADLPTGSWLMVLDHRLYGVMSNQDGLVRLG